MFIGQIKVSRNGRSYIYDRLLESVRTDKGPRQPELEHRESKHSVYPLGLDTSERVC